jgi:hypothetical protein
MAPKNKAKQKPGSMRSRQQAKLNSQRAQKSPIEPARRIGPRRQLPPSSQGQNRVGNSSQPWGPEQKTGLEVRQTRTDTSRPALPPAREAMPASGNRPQLPPGRQGGDLAKRPSAPEKPAKAAANAGRGNRLKGLVGTRGRAVGAGLSIAGSALSGDAKGAAITGSAYAAGKALQAVPDPRVKLAGKGLELAAPFAPAIADGMSRMGQSGKQRPNSGRSKADLIGKTGARDKGSTATNGRYVPGKEQSKFTDSEAAKPAEKQPARPVRSASQQPTTAVRNPSPKAKASTPSKPAPKASETYRDGGRGLYQGSKEYRDKVGGSGNPLLNRFRKEMGLDQATGQRADAPTVAKEAPKQEPKAASKSGGEGVKDSLKIDQAATKADSSKYFNQASTDKMPKSETAEQRRKRERMLAARKSGLA